MAYRKNSKPTQDEQKMMLDNGIEVSVEMEDGVEVEIEMLEEENGVTEDELQGIVAGEIDDAQAYIDDIISPERATAGQYYKGEPFGNEEEGRSQVVSMDVRDTVQAIMPSIMRVFFGSSNVVEFAPTGPEDVANAEQATDYVNYCLTRDNNLFMVCYETCWSARTASPRFGGTKRKMCRPLNLKVLHKKLIPFFPLIQTLRSSK